MSRKPLANKQSWQSFAGGSSAGVWDFSEPEQQACIPSAEATSAAESNTCSTESRQYPTEQKTVEKTIAGASKRNGTDLNISIGFEGYRVSVSIPVKCASGAIKSSG
jgi:hypothetical protein